MNLLYITNAPRGAFVIIQKLVYYNPIVIGQLLITQIY